MSEYLCSSGDDLGNDSLDLKQPSLQLVYLWSDALQVGVGVSKHFAEGFGSRFELRFDLCREFGQDLGDSLVHVNVSVWF